MSNIDPMLMRQIIMDHYDYPRNKELTKDNGYMSRHMASDSCIDDITVQTKISDGKIGRYSFCMSCLYDFNSFDFNYV